MAKKIRVRWPVLYRVKLGLARDVIAEIAEATNPKIPIFGQLAIWMELRAALRKLDSAIALFEDEYGDKENGCPKGKAKVEKESVMPKSRAKTKAGKQRKVATVLSEFKEGKLRSSSGAKVTDRKQAVAIGLSEAGLSKPKKRTTRRKRT